MHSLVALLVSVSVSVCAREGICDDLKERLFVILTDGLH